MDQLAVMEVIVGIDTGRQAGIHIPTHDAADAWAVAYVAKEEKII